MSPLAATAMVAAGEAVKRMNAASNRSMIIWSILFPCYILGLLLMNRLILYLAMSRRSLFGCLSGLLFLHINMTINKKSKH